VAVLSGLILFLLVQLGLAVSIESVLPEVRDPVYGCRLDCIRRRLRTAPVKPWTVMMLGSSRTQLAFRIGKGEENAWSETLGHPVAAFNFGVPGGASLTELLTWRRLRRDGVRPNLLLIEVLPAYLAGPSWDYGEGFLPTDRLAWQDLPLIERYAGNPRKNLRCDWLESWPMACYNHRLSLMRLVVPSLLPAAYQLKEDAALEDSGAPRFVDVPVTSEQRRRATQVASDDYHARFGGFHLGGPQCQALRELLVSSSRKGCRSQWW
jgi:hypothetical protein